MGTLPTEDDLRAVPLAAKMAFAARCARRVHPLFAESWPDAPPEFGAVIEGAIALTESWARFECPDTSREDAAVGAYRVARIADNCVRFMGETGRRVAYAVAASAGRAADTTHVTGPMEASARSAAAARAAVEAMRNLSEVPAVVAAMRHDYDVLRLLTEQEHWTDATPVTPELCGPLWPDGAPPGWPAPSLGQSTAVPAMKIEIVVPQRMTAAESEQFNARVGQFYAALSAFHAAMGGEGLRIIDEGSTGSRPSWKDGPTRARRRISWRSSLKERIGGAR